MIAAGSWTIEPQGSSAWPPLLAVCDNIPFADGLLRAHEGQPPQRQLRADTGRLGHIRGSSARCSANLAPRTGSRRVRGLYHIHGHPDDAQERRTEQREVPGKEQLHPENDKWGRRTARAVPTATFWRSAWRGMLRNDGRRGRASDGPRDGYAGRRNTRRNRDFADGHNIHCKRQRGDKAAIVPSLWPSHDSGCPPAVGGCIAAYFGPR